MGAKLLMFDFDGVIADSLEFFHRSLAEACEKHGVFSVWEREVFLGIFDGNMAEGIVGLGLPKEKVVLVLDEMRCVLGAGFGGVPFFPGIVSAINGLAEESPVYIITSNLGEVVAASLAQNGVCGVREVLGSDVEPSKVKKIQTVKSRWPGHEPFYFGDTLGDMIEGREAGAKTVGVCWGWHGRKRLAAASPDFLFETPEELFSGVRGLA